MRSQPLYVLLTLTLFLTAACTGTAEGPSGPETVVPDPMSATLDETPVARPADTGPVDFDPSQWVAPGTRGLILAGGKIVVDDDGAQCPKADYTTIQAAVDDAAAQPGAQKIEVCAGSYPEDVSIGPNNPLKLKGDGVGSTVVTGVPGSSEPIIDIVMADEVGIERLTVDGQSDRSGVTYGIRYYDTDGEVKDVEVKNIRNASGSTNGRGIGVLAGLGGPAGANVKIQKSLVENYTRIGIFVNGEGANAEVKDNRVIGPVLPRVHGPNGIQVSRGAEARVKKNIVDNNPSPNPPGGAGSGIILFCAGETRVDHNHVTRSDLGISLVDNQDGEVKKNLIEDNHDGISLQFLGVLFGDIGCGPNGTPVVNNTVEKNDVRDSGDDGISFANFDETNAPDSPSNNAVNRNEISGSGDAGVSVGHGSRNLLEKNQSNGSGDEGFFVDDDTSDNIFEKNQASGSGVWSCEDQSIGSGTEGTANIWEKNTGQADDTPDGICP